MLSRTYRDYDSDPAEVLCVISSMSGRIHHPKMFVNPTKQYFTGIIAILEKAYTYRECAIGIHYILAIGVVMSVV